LSLSPAYAAPAGEAARRRLGAGYMRGRMRQALDWSVAFWIFCGGFVLIEPSPYEMAFLFVLPLAFAGGLYLHKSTFALLGMMLCFAPFAVVGAFQSEYYTTAKALTYVSVTIYLWLTAYVVANYVADDPIRHMKVVIGSYVAVACLVAAIGTLAYLGLMPGRELFLRYGRAKALFKDPNVFAPFLILPAMYALQRILLTKGRRALIATAIYGLLFVGVFVSFSRAAWGHYLGSSALLFVAIFAGEARTREKVRMLKLMLIGVVAMTVILGGLLSIDSVRRLFEVRFSLEQSYDSGSTGRFARQSYALDLALTHPWGMGPGDFATQTRIAEEPHDVYVNVFLSYGWFGGFAFVAMIFSTMWLGLTRVVKPSPQRLLLIPLVATWVPLCIESAIIDTDHWRHLFLISGLIWGVTAVYKPSLKAARNDRSALI